MDLEIVWGEKLLLNVMNLLKKKMQSELLSLLVNVQIIQQRGGFSSFTLRGTRRVLFFLPQVSLQPFTTLLSVGCIFVKSFQSFLPGQPPARLENPCGTDTPLLGNGHHRFVFVTKGRASATAVSFYRNLRGLLLTS